MVKNERQAYLKAIRSRYRPASKQGKSAILEEFCEVCGYNRKYTIRLLNTPNHHASRKKKAGRRKVYDSPDLIKALKHIWFATDQICSKKLKAAIPLWLPFYESHFLHWLPP